MISYDVYVKDSDGCYNRIAGFALMMDGGDNSFSDATNKTVKKFCDGLKVNAEARFLKLRDGISQYGDHISVARMKELEKQQGICFSYSSHQRSLSYA